MLLPLWFSEKTQTFSVTLKKSSPFLDSGSLGRHPTHNGWNGVVLLFSLSGSGDRYLRKSPLSSVSSSFSPLTVTGNCSGEGRIPWER